MMHPKPCPKSPDGASSVILAYGANLPTQGSIPANTVRTAISRSNTWGRVVAISGLWRSVAWPDPDSPPYVNAAAMIATDLAPDCLLAKIHELEESLGRRRNQRNEPRTIDVDVVDYAGHVYGWIDGRAPTGLQSSGELVLPHPRAHERAFVLAPVRDVAPRWRHPVWQVPVSRLWAALPVDVRAECTRISKPQG